MLFLMTEFNLFYQEDVFTELEDWKPEKFLQCQKEAIWNILISDEFIAFIPSIASLIDLIYEKTHVKLHYEDAMEIIYEFLSLSKKLPLKT